MFNVIDEDMTLARPKRRYYHVYQRRRRRAVVTWF